MRKLALVIALLLTSRAAALNPVGGQTNVIRRTMLAKADGSAITAGTVNLYVYAETGANAGKWYRDSDDTWQATEAISKALTHVADGHWVGTVDAACWADGVEYLIYAKESGNLHVPCSTNVRCESTVSSRAAAATALTNATWTDAKAGYLDAAITSRGTSTLTQTQITAGPSDMTSPSCLVN